MYKLLYFVLIMLTGTSVLLIFRIGDQESLRRSSKKKRIIAMIFFGWLALISVIYVLKNFLMVW